jgi:hypothetical protein
VNERSELAELARADALARHRDFREMLTEELGIEPSRPYASWSAGSCSTIRRSKAGADTAQPAAT